MIETGKRYDDFIEKKSQHYNMHGFEPVFMPGYLFDFQQSLVGWACRKGRAAILADCGLGKTIIQLVWAENVIRKVGGKVLVLAPLAVGPQTVREGEKFGIECYQSRDGKIPEDKNIIVTNYEKLHLFNPQDFVGCVADESSIIKHFTGATQKGVTRFMTKLSYRLLCTATAAPNDYIELGTSSEALGELSYSDMLSRFFKYLDDKGQRSEERKQEFAQRAVKHFARLSFRVHQSIGQWRLKHHAEIPFWKWVCSWARACRKPSDLGFDDEKFILPELKYRNHIIKPETPPEGWLFTTPAFGLKEEREERKRLINERCELVAKLADHNDPVIVWCHTNDEGDLLEKIIPGSRQVRGSTPDEEREQIYSDFCSGKLRALVIKPKIGAWGMNFQHCAHVIIFASHSHEQFYQSVRRCWRFGQTRPVTVDIISTEGEVRTRDNMFRKAKQADVMFGRLVEFMNSENVQKREKVESIKMEVPSWIQSK